MLTSPYAAEGSATCARVANGHVDSYLKANTTRNQYASPPRGNAITAGPLNDFDEILCSWWIPNSPFILFINKILTL